MVAPKAKKPQNAAFGVEMDASQTAGLATLIGILAYPTLLWVANAIHDWKERRRLKRMYKTY
jgi:hypothetical protein